MAGPPANRVRQSYGSAPATPRERVYVSRAADDPPESAPPAGCTRKSRPDPGIDRASSPSRRITAGKVNHRPFALASFFSKLLEHLLEDGARSGVPRRAAGNRSPREALGPRPPGTRTRMRGARCDRSGRKSGEGSAAPGPKIATVERREAGVPRQGTQGASQAPGVSEHAERVLRKHPTFFRRSAHPSFRVREAKGKPRAQKRAAGTKRCCLGVRLSVGHSGRGAIAARAGIHNHWPWIWIPGSRASPAPRNDAEKARRGYEEVLLGRSCVEALAPLRDASRGEGRGRRRHMRAALIHA